MEEGAENIFNYISTLKPYYQVGFGAAFGWLTGFVLMKIGKLTAIILGGALIIIKIAEIERVVQIDWWRVKENFQNLSSKTSNNFTLSNKTEMVESVHNFLVSFIGGSMIGIGCS